MISFVKGSARCGTGVQTRSRKCNSNKDIKCEGFSEQKKICINNSECKDEWSEWSDCSANCGPGVKTRRKLCVDDKPCSNETHLIEETIGCFSINNCIKSNNKIMDQIVNWSEWSECSNKCGYGLKTRFQSCFQHRADCLGMKKIEQITCLDETGCENQSS